MDATSFHVQLRAARQRAGFAQLTDFADALSVEGIVYSDDALGHWENGRRRPPNREALFGVLKLIADRGGLRSLAEVNALLYSLDWRDLNGDEQGRHFSTLTNVLPDNLPRLPIARALVGREALVTEVVASVLDPEALPVAMITGLGGIGKTAIAYEVAQRAFKSGQFDSMAWVSSKSESFVGARIQQQRADGVTLTTLLIALAQQLKIAVPSQADLNALANLISTALETRRALIVLDNLETVEAARGVAQLMYQIIAPSGSRSGSRLLITSRERLPDEPYVVEFYVRGLELLDAITLLRQEAVSRRAEKIIEASDALLGQIHRTTGGMPLALILLVSQSLLGIALDTELERLQKAVNEEELYRFIYFALWQKLTEGAQKVLVGAATFVVPAQRAHVIRVSQSDSDRFEVFVTELVRSSLLEVFGIEAENQRYSMHPMTRWFVNAPLANLWRTGKFA